MSSLLASNSWSVPKHMLVTNTLTFPRSPSYSRSPSKLFRGRARSSIPASTSFPSIFSHGLIGAAAGQERLIDTNSEMSAPPPQQGNVERYVVIHVATTCDEHGVYVTKDSAEVIELGWILLDGKTCDEV